MTGKQRKKGKVCDATDDPRGASIVQSRHQEETCSGFSDVGTDGEDRDGSSKLC